METRQISDMDIDNHNNNNNYSSFQNTRTSNNSLSTTRTIQAQGNHDQRGTWTVKEEHLGDFLPIEQHQQQKLNAPDQRRQMHPSNRHIAQRNSSQRRRSTEQQEQRQQIVMENRQQCLQRREGRQQWQLEQQHRQVQMAGSWNELARQRHTSQEFFDDELNEKLHQLQVYDNDQIDSKEQWEQEQLKLFEELQQMEQEALVTSYIEHLKHIKLMDDKEKEKPR